MKKYTFFINTAERGQITLALFGHERKVEKSTTYVEHAFSERLLTGINRLLAKRNVSPVCLNKIIVVEGPGRFSAIRTGITTANMLGWSLNIPVIPISGIQKITDEVIIHLIKKNKAQTFKKPAAPVYGQEPNISKPKKVGM